MDFSKYQSVIDEYEQYARYYEALEFSHLAELFRKGAAVMRIMMDQLEKVANPPIENA